jgi:hypothetical protein
MPYIIETRTAEEHDGEFFYHPADTSRVAVATLDEARTAAWDAACATGIVGLVGQWRRQAENLPEQGGSVGPLPDGTTIEVKQIRWEVLRGWVHGMGVSAWREPQATVIDAFNAQEVTA